MATNVRKCLELFTSDPEGFAKCHSFPVVVKHGSLEKRQALDWLQLKHIANKQQCLLFATCQAQPQQVLPHFCNNLSDFIHCYEVVSGEDMIVSVSAMESRGTMNGVNGELRV